MRSQGSEPSTVAPIHSRKSQAHRWASQQRTWYNNTPNQTLEANNRWQLKHKHRAQHPDPANPQIVGIVVVVALAAIAAIAALLVVTGVRSYLKFLVRRSIDPVAARKRPPLRQGDTWDSKVAYDRL